MKLDFLDGVLSDGTPYTITIEAGSLVFQRFEDRHTTLGPAGLMDLMKARGWELPTDAEALLCKLAHQGADTVSHLVDMKGHYDLVTADDIDTALQKFADVDVKEAIRTLLLGRRTHADDTTM